MRKGCDGENILFRGVICCSGGLYAVQGGYMLFRWVIWMFRGAICCSGGLYAVQEGYMDVQGLYAENNSENSGQYRSWQSTASRRPTATPNARANSEFSVLFWSKALISDLRPGPS